MTNSLNAQKIIKGLNQVLVLCFTIFALSTVYSSELWAFSNKPVIKVFSGLCKSSSLKLEGSGMGFSFQGKPYILTSEHVVAHSNGEYCHRIFYPGKGEYDAQLVAVDWGLGAAILAIKTETLNKSSFNWDSIDTWDRQQSGAGTRVRTAGFPHGQQTLLSSNMGSILTAASHRHFLARPTSIIEILGAHGEFGMSGGAVFDESQEHFIGMLSHQYLKLVEGNRTLVGDYENSSVKNHLLVIPSRDLKSWVQNVIKPMSRTRPLFLREPMSQLTAKNIVVTSGLRFEAVADNSHCAPEEKLSSVESGDPVGIGGLGSVRKGFVSIHISLAPNAPKTRWYLPSRSSWIEEVRSHLYRRNKIDVAYLIHRNLGNGYLSKECVGSLSEFFRKLNSTEVNPVTLLQRHDGEPRADSLVRLVQHSNNLNQQVDVFLELVKADTATDPHREVGRQLSLEYLAELKTVAETLVGEDWTFIEPHDFSRYMEELRSGESAAYLASLHFDLTVELREELLILKDILEKLRL